MLSDGNVVLAEEPGREVVVGTIGKLHNLIDQQPVPMRNADEFARFDEPGYQKLAMGWRTNEGDGGGCELCHGASHARAKPGLAKEVRSLLVADDQGWQRRPGTDAAAGHQAARRTSIWRVDGARFVEEGDQDGGKDRPDNGLPPWPTGRNPGWPSSSGFCSAGLPWGSTSGPGSTSSSRQLSGWCSSRCPETLGSGSAR
jgi:hypothetical protein